MDDFLKFMLKKKLGDLGELLGEDGNKKDDDKLKAAIILIYNSSKERICKVADNFAKGLIEPEDKLKIIDNPEEIQLPETEEWDFRLGDAVKVKLSRDDFKWMQKKTLGWRCDLNKVQGQVGIVTTVLCKYENSIQVYFPDIFTACSLYAGLLEKVPSPEYPNLQKRWKPGDYVTTISSTTVLKLLQRGLDHIPTSLIGKKARIVAVTHPCVIATFDEKKTYDLKSGSIVTCHDTTPIKLDKIVHARGFKVGNKVKIISNMKKLIENQEKFGGWNESMSSIRGKVATVINVQEDGSLNVQIKNSRSWRLAPDSVLEMDNEDPYEAADDLKFFPGDVVKVIVPRNIRSILAMAEVPNVFLEYLREPAVLSLVDDNFDYYIRFNSDQNIQTHKDIIRNATASEKKRYDRIQELKEKISIGDQVHVDIGSPNFVHSVLKDLDLPAKVSMALTKSATLIGFVNAYSAVIKYEDGTMFRVKKKFLTVPKKFFIEETKTTIDLDTISLIKSKLETSVQDIHSRDGSPIDGWNIATSCLLQGKPPFVEFKVESAVAAFKPIFEWLDENSGWDIGLHCEGQIFIRGAVQSNENLEIKVGLIFNDEASKFFTDQEASGAAETVSGSNSEQPRLGNEATPTSSDNDRPSVERLEDFKYIRFFDEALAQNVYFPYVLHGERRTPIQPIAPAHPPAYAPVAFIASYDRNCPM